jgi:integrase
MPRLTRSVPSYRKHKTSGLSFVELNGHRIYLGPHGTKASKDAYDRAVAEWLANGRQVAQPSEALSIVEMCDRYRIFAERYYVKNGRPTCLARIKQAMKCVRELYGREPANTFGPLALRTIRQGMIERDLSRRYINELVDCIRRAFKWAAAEELIPASVPQALAMVAGLRRGKTAARETPPVTPVDDAIVTATLPHVTPVVAAMIRIQRLTGMRPQEVCGLSPTDIDTSGEIWAYRPESHKTEHFGRSRTILIGPLAQQLLHPYLDRAPADFCFQPKEAFAAHLAARHAARKTPLRCGNRPGSNRRTAARRRPGSHFNVAAYRRAIHRGCDRAFLHPTLSDIKEKDLTTTQRAELKEWRAARRWSPNALRHAAGTAIRKQFGLEATQVILGHASAKVSEIYAERDWSKGAEVARLIG